MLSDAWRAWVAENALEDVSDEELVATPATKRPAITALLEDVRPPHPLLDTWRDGECVFLWVGPEGTVNPESVVNHDVLGGAIPASCQADDVRVGAAPKLDEASDRDAGSDPRSIQACDAPIVR